jgi:putative oxidoreductase
MESRQKRRWSVLTRHLKATIIQYTPAPFVVNWLLQVEELPPAAAIGAQLLHTGTGLMLAWHHGLHKLRDGLDWKAGRRANWPFLDEVRAAGFPLALPNAWLATVVQMVGGLCLMAGFLTRPMALLLTGTLLGAVYTTLALRKDSEMALIYLLLLLAVVLVGAGPWSLDSLLFIGP